MEKEKRISFLLRVIHNQIRDIIHKNAPRFDKGPKSQLQGGILGYLFDHEGQPVYQKDLEKEFRISRATATNTLQVMERDGLAGHGQRRQVKADSFDPGSIRESSNH